MSPTHVASHNGQAQATPLLLKYNANVNTIGVDKYTTLHWASSAGHTNIMEILLDHRVNININAMINLETPLHLVLLHGILDVVR
jgi:ankyrin repeat protein